MFFAPTTPRSRAVRAGLAATALLLVASCSGSGSDPGAEPDTEKSLDLSPSESPTSKWTPEEQGVVDSLVAYNDLVTAVSQDKELKQDTMRRVAAEPFATKIAKQLAAQRSAGFVMEGEEEYRPRTVQLAGNEATLVTCWDPSTATIVNEYQTPPATVKPYPRTLVTFTLEQPRGRWLVTGRDSGRSC